MIGPILPFISKQKEVIVVNEVNLQVARKFINATHKTWEELLKKYRLVDVTETKKSDKSTRTKRPSKPRS